MSAQALPEELLELILHHIDDKSQLSCCSLVCRVWLFPSSRLLFRKLELNVQPQPESPDTACHNWHDYLKAMKASARIQHCVRKLSFYSSKGKWPVWPASILLETLRTLPNLKSITLARLNFSFDDDISPSPLVSHWLEDGLSLDTVELRDISSLGTYHGQAAESGASESMGLAAILGLFTSIRFLSIRYTMLPRRYPATWHGFAPIPLPRQTPLKLEELHLKGELGAKMLGALKEMVDSHHLRVLFVELSAPVLSLADEFVRRMTALQTVRFAIRGDLMEMRLAILVNLSACAELKSICICPFRYYPYNQVEATNVYIGCTVVSILSTAPPSVRWIRLYLDTVVIYPSLTVLRQVDWTSFSRSLERLSQLEVLELSPWLSSRWTNDMIEVVKGELSPATRQALQFT
ncbi:uncharacterized protein PHACADRAFT_203506 [Phanerochaete carnosa HHB-10118-sp]|uniref:F-box domain-containing protein n=1 Tax=Phanerochaete carnosa (strain HHB-10118-sp) TaxID=650164 RepID=K5VBI3_PHACS|nr:uncharacterized protein PHACADRAFT_203506 [Phanerochaete carnosa HHB-10118-sp]EKM60261.1 hypothetical protein PHACADRAFT_203506 [Phanerochaete carnosa HHB-10118-sp]